jgi:two-component system nitrate/nitrite response regulator NarL
MQPFEAAVYSDSSRLKNLKNGIAGVSDHVAPATKTGVYQSIVCHPSRLFIEGLARILENTRFEIVGSGATIAAALSDASSADVARILVCGLRDPDDVRRISSELQMAKSKFPELRVVLLADSVTPRLLVLAAEWGVDAVLSDNICSDVLLGALNLVLLGQRLFPPPPTDTSVDEADARPPVAASAEPARSKRSRPVDHIPVLSEREDQILRFLTSGTRNKLIAHDLGITEATVKFHIRALMRKLGAANRTQAAILGMSRNMASL